MALAQASDDSLRQIISFLTAQDVMRLMATGSKRVMARVARNTTCLNWAFSRPAYFPTCSFAFSNLRSLSITVLANNGHLSLHGRTLHPPEPMESLQSLVLALPDSHLLFAPNGGMCLPSSYPKLTSLTIHAKKGPLPSDWIKSLPKGLLSLTIGVGRNSSADITPSTIDKLPKGLQHLEFADQSTVGAGEINLHRFPDLQVLRICNVRSWDVLKSLPDSLEELSISCSASTAPMATFSLSKLPPKIRVLTLSGHRLKLNFDTMAPPTIEKLELTLQHHVEAHQLEKFFHTKNLRVLGDIGFYESNLTIHTLSVIPNVTELDGLGGIESALDTLEIIPRKLESVALMDHMRPSPSVSYQHLPPSLKSFFGPIMCAEDVADLPKSITSLSIGRPENSSLTLPASVWRDLPSRLTELDVQTCLFESEECFQALPDGIQVLILILPQSDETGQRITFSKSLQESLETLQISLQRSSSRQERMDEESPFFAKLSSFSRLSNIRISVRTIYKSSTLSSLPKTLQSLILGDVEFENYGLPLGQEVETSADWKEGALSRLPEGLELLSLDFWQKSSASIDFRLFSHLPRCLASLVIKTDQVVCYNPKSFISSLPRRISCLRYYFNRQGHPGVESYEQDPDERELEEAIEEYYSDPFWDGQRYS